MMGLIGHVRLPEQTPEQLNSPNFDSYLSRLQGFCAQNYVEKGRPVYDGVRSAFKDFIIPPAPT